MRRYKIISGVLEYLVFTILPILLISFVVSVLVFHYSGVQVTMLGVAIVIMTMKNLYNLYNWVTPRLKS